MMKKNPVTIIIIVLLVFFPIVAFALVTLGIPQNLVLEEDGIASWDIVDNTSLYGLSVGVRKDNDIEYAYCILIDDFTTDNNRATCNLASWLKVGCDRLGYTSGKVSICYRLYSESSDATFYKSSDYSEPSNEITFSLDEPAIVDSGEWGGLRWSISDSGILDITGSGPMKDFNWYGEFSRAWTPWLTDTISEIRIGEGVTSIGYNAFNSCYNLLSITIPESVNRINDRAFRDCYSLKTVTFLGDLTYLGQETFLNCNNLCDFTLPNGLTTISKALFAGCEKLTTLSIPEGVTTIEEDFISYGGWNDCCVAFVYIPDSVTSIHRYAFRGARHFKQIICSDDSYAAKWADSNGIVHADHIETEQDGWLQDNGNWYYYQQGTLAISTWIDDGAWYYFDATGAMVTGWLLNGGNWYYMQPSGEMATGWISDGSAWYYMQPSGVMATGWISDGGAWYYMKPSGAMATGWITDGSAWYYMKSSGAMTTGWVYDGGKWYYMKSSGAMATGWTYAGGNWYYFRNSGAMATGWFEDKEAEEQLPAGQKRALWYWFDENGVMAKGWKEIDGQWEMFDNNGEWLYTWDGN